MEPPEISFRHSVTREMRELLPQMAQDATLWMTQHYPDVDFSNITWEATGGKTKSRYFHREKRVLVCHSGFVGFYRRACRNIKGLKEKIGTYHPSFVTTSIIVHELTHHVQHERGFHRGNETDTSLNELCWMREHRPGLFLRCFSGKPPDILPAPIRPKRPRATTPPEQPPRPDTNNEKRRSVNMSRKGVKLGRRAVNKTQKIREIAQKMTAEGRPPRPIEIVDILKTEGVHVSSGQVCVALRNTGLQLKELQKFPRTSMEDLERIDRLAKEIGCDRLLAALEVYRTLRKD